MTDKKPRQIIYQRQTKLSLSSLQQRPTQKSRPKVNKRKIINNK